MRHWCGWCERKTKQMTMMIDGPIPLQYWPYYSHWFIELFCLNCRYQAIYVLDMP